MLLAFMLCTFCLLMQCVLSEEDVCLVVASDGLWEFLDTQAIADAIAVTAVETEGDEVAALVSSLVVIADR